MSNPNKMLQIAVEAALKSEYNTYRIGAAIFSRKGALISTGFNKQKTHVRQAKWAFEVGQPLRQFLHAEIDALIKCRHGDPYSIVIVRLTSKGLAMAKPCAVCQRALLETHINKIYWTNERGQLVCGNPGM